MVLEGLDGLVDELAVWGGVPPEPIACVAVEAVAVEHRWLVGVVAVLAAVDWRFLGRFFL